jgi:DNA-binding transcriptional LysR family regulator
MHGSIIHKHMATPKAPSWDHYQTLLAVLETGSLSAAARELNLSQPTVGRHVEQLEQALGLPLFTRSPQGLKPTDFARDLKPHIQNMASAADAALRDASGETQSVSGVVRIAASEIIGSEVLPPMLAEFSDRHPGVVIELSVSNRREDLLRREADIAVRAGRPTQGALVARRVGVVRLGLYAHRNYLQRRGVPETIRGGPLKARGHSVIGFDRDPLVQRKVDELQLHITRDLFTFRSDSDIAQLAAIRAGLGVGAIQTGIAARDPNLERVLQDDFLLEMDFWVAMHEDLKSSLRMRLMFDHLVEGLSAYIASSPP